MHVLLIGVVLRNRTAEHSMATSFPLLYAGKKGQAEGI